MSGIRDQNLDHLVTYKVCHIIYIIDFKKGKKKQRIIRKGEQLIEL